MSCENAESAQPPFVYSVPVAGMILMGIHEFEPDDVQWDYGSTWDFYDLSRRDEIRSAFEKIYEALIEQYPHTLSVDDSTEDDRIALRRIRFEFIEIVQKEGGGIGQGEWIRRTIHYPADVRTPSWLPLEGDLSRLYHDDEVPC